MNKADNDASTRAIDSLINYEASSYVFCEFFYEFDMNVLHIYGTPLLCVDCFVIIYI